jgi:hypothetical protein
MGRKARKREASKAAGHQRLVLTVVDIWVLRLTTALAVLLGTAMVVGVLFPMPGLHEGWKLALLGAAEVFILLRAYLAFRAQARMEVALWVMGFTIVLLSLWAT